VAADTTRADLLDALLRADRHGAFLFARLLQAWEINRALAQRVAELEAEKRTLK